MEINLVSTTLTVENTIILLVLVSSKLLDQASVIKGRSTTNYLVNLVQFAMILNLDEYVKFVDKKH